MGSKISKIFNTFSYRERSLFIGSVLILAVSLAFWSAQLFYKKTAEKPVEGGVYNEGVIGQPVTINPLIATSDVDRDLR